MGLRAVAPAPSTWLKPRGVGVGSETVPKAVTLSWERNPTESDGRRRKVTSLEA